MRSTLVKCPKCGKPKLPHTICWNCGYYKNREVIDVLKKLTKKERKKKEKEMKEKEKTITRPKLASAERDPEKKAKPLTMEELSKK